MKDADFDPIRIARNAVLKMKDPLGSLPVKTKLYSDDATLSDVLYAVVEYIYHCLDFGDNPLPHLRRYFPDFDWAFHKPSTVEEVARVGKDVDYILAGLYSDWGEGLFTATRKNAKEKKKICFCPRGHHDQSPELDMWPYEELAKVGARVLFTSYEHISSSSFNENLQLVSCEEAKKLVEQARKLRRS